MDEVDDRPPKPKPFMDITFILGVRNPANMFVHVSRTTSVGDRSKVLELVLVVVVEPADVAEFLLDEWVSGGPVGAGGRWVRRLSSSRISTAFWRMMPMSM